MIDWIWPAIAFAEGAVSPANGVNELQLAVTGLLASAILGAIKFVYGAIKERVPKIFMPVIAWVITIAITALGKKFGLSLPGNPEMWDLSITTTLAATAVGVGGRELVQQLLKVLKKVPGIFPADPT